MVSSSDSVLLCFIASRDKSSLVASGRVSRSGLDFEYLNKYQCYLFLPLFAPLPLLLSPDDNPPPSHYLHIIARYPGAVHTSAGHAAGLRK